MAEKYFIALTQEGTEYLYNYASAHSVPGKTQKPAQKIADALNTAGYQTENGARKWHVYENDGYSSGAVYAEYQHCYKRGGKIYIKSI